MERPRWNQVCWAISLLCGIAYFFASHVAIKAGAVGAMSVLAWRSDRALAIPLAFSTLGDVLLDLGDTWFPAGLGSFLVAHLFYVRLFRRRWLAQRYFGVLSVFAFSGGLTAILWPHLGAMRIPVVAYILAITAMAASAVLADLRTPWVAVGALSFVISDSILGYHRFAGPVPYRGVLVWSTYYFAQAAITAGWLSENDRVG